MASDPPPEEILRDGEIIGLLLQIIQVLPSAAFRQEGLSAIGNSAI